MIFLNFMIKLTNHAYFRWHNVLVRCWYQLSIYYSIEQIDRWTNCICRVFALRLSDIFLLFKDVLIYLYTYSYGPIFPTANKKCFPYEHFPNHQFTSTPFHQYFHFWKENLFLSHMGSHPVGYLSYPDLRTFFHLSLRLSIKDNAATPFSLWNFLFCFSLGRTPYQLHLFKSS